MTEQPRRVPRIVALSKMFDLFPEKVADNPARGIASSSDSSTNQRSTMESTAQITQQSWIPDSEVNGSSPLGPLNAAESQLHATHTEAEITCAHIEHALKVGDDGELTPGWTVTLHARIGKFDDEADFRQQEAHRAAHGTGLGALFG